MDITLLAKERTIVIHFQGEIDHYVAQQIKTMLEREIKKNGAINIAMDFERVTFMDSSGIGMIMGRYKTVTALGGKIIIYGASYQVQRLLEMAGVINMVVMSQSLQSGLEMLREGAKMK